MDSALSIVSFDHDHYMSGKLPTNPSPKPTSMLTSHLYRAKYWLWGGVGGQFPGNV